MRGRRRKKVISAEVRGANWICPDTFSESHYLWQVAMEHGGSASGVNTAELLDFCLL